MSKEINFDEIKLRFISNGKNYDLKAKIENELKLSEENINENLKDQPGLFAFYVILSEVAEDKLRDEKLQLDMLTSKLSEKYRNEFLKKSNVKPTIPQIDAQVLTDEQYIAKAMEVNEWKKMVGILTGIKEAFRHRKEVLIALASNMRAQMDVEVFVEKDKLKRRAL